MRNGRSSLPRSRRGGVGDGDAASICEPCSTACSTSWKPVASGDTCRETYRRAARATAICNCGPGTEPWSASITSFIGASASSKAGRPARPPPSLTARASAQRKKGARIGPGRLRRREEDQRRQVPHPRRHARTVAERGGPPRRYSGPRRGRPGARQKDEGALPVHPGHLRRRRLPGPCCGDRGEQNRRLAVKRTPILGPGA